MAVTDYTMVNRAQINTKHPGITQQTGSLTGVEQQLQTVDLDMIGQAMFSNELFLVYQIFYQRSNHIVHNTMGNDINAINLDNQCCFALYAASRAVVKALKPYLDSLDVTYPQYLVLLVLWEDSPVSVGFIGKRLMMDIGTLSPLLKRMEKKQLITRTRDAGDERTVNIAITGQGLAKKDRAVNMPLNRLNKDSLNKERFFRLRRELFEIIALLEET